MRYTLFKSASVDFIILFYIIFFQTVYTDAVAGKQINSGNRVLRRSVLSNYQTTHFRTHEHLIKHRDVSGDWNRELKLS